MLSAHGVTLYIVMNVLNHLNIVQYVKPTENQVLMIQVFVSVKMELGIIMESVPLVLILV